MDVDRGELTRRVLAHCAELGFELAGVAALDPSRHAAYYHDWIATGRHGSMEYLARPDAVEARLDPRRRWESLQSAVVVALGYDPEVPAPQSDTPNSDAAHGNRPERGVIARYARGRDYHKVIKSKLLQLLERIEGDVGHALPAARAYVDTGPLLERDLARRAGLGWFGRSTMLVNPTRGSFFFIGALLVELDLVASEAFEKDHCGTCSACVDACPTGALLGRNADGAPVMDATRCISYLTIENRGAIPRELRSAIGNRIYGCDICQEVCPFTRRFSRATAEPSFAARGPGEAPFGVDRLAGDGWHAGTASPSLIDLMSMNESGWEAFSRGSPVRRAGRAGFRRNVAVALGNWGDDAGVPSLKAAITDSDPLVRSHAAWALGAIGSTSAIAVLHDALPGEMDRDVIEEMRLALDAAGTASVEVGKVSAR